MTKSAGHDLVAFGDQFLGRIDIDDSARSELRLVCARNGDDRSSRQSALSAIEKLNDFIFVITLADQADVRRGDRVPAVDHEAWSAAHSTPPYCLRRQLSFPIRMR